MTPEQVAAFLALVDVFGNLSPFAIAVGVILILYRRLYVSKGESDERVAAEREKTAVVKEESERREGLYIATIAELRLQVADANKTREKIQDELTESTKVLYRFTDVLNDLREQTRPR